MALSNQSDLLAFIITRKVNLKIPINASLPRAGIAHPRKMSLGCWFHQILFGIPACCTPGFGQSR
jgi:hypothetical protein